MPVGGLGVVEGVARFAALAGSRRRAWSAGRAARRASWRRRSPRRPRASASPKKSVEMPPTKPTGTPRRPSASATLCDRSAIGRPVGERAVARFRRDEVDQRLAAAEDHCATVLPRRTIRRAVPSVHYGLAAGSVYIIPRPTARGRMEPRSDMRGFRCAGQGGSGVSEGFPLAPARTTAALRRATSPAGEIVAQGRVLVFPPEETELLFRTNLKNYLFYVRDGVTEDAPYYTALAMAPISFCNHSDEHNCDFRLDEKAEEITLVARRRDRGERGDHHRLRRLRREDHLSASARPA